MSGVSLLFIRTQNIIETHRGNVGVGFIRPEGGDGGILPPLLPSERKMRALRRRVPSFCLFCNCSSVSRSPVAPFLLKQVHLFSLNFKETPKNICPLVLFAICC